METRWKSFVAVMWLLALSAVAGSEPRRETITGWVSDENCGALHTEPGGADCIQKCIKGAPHLNPEWVAQRMVFVSDSDGSIGLVANPEFLKGEEGQHLRIEVEKVEDDEAPSLLVLSKARIDEERDP